MVLSQTNFRLSRRKRCLVEGGSRDYDKRRNVRGGLSPCFETDVGTEVEGVVRKGFGTVKREIRCQCQKDRNGKRGGGELSHNGR